MDVVDLVWRSRCIDVPAADVACVQHVLTDVAAVRRWLDGVEVACAGRLAELAVGCASLFPEQITAKATRGSLRDGARLAGRATTAGAVPELGSALAAGDVSGQHLDAVTAALGQLTPDQQHSLAAQGRHLAQAATVSTPDEFRREVAKRVRQIQADDGMARLERQQRAVRLRAWLDKQTGMLRLSGEIDPEEGLALLGRLNNQVEALFHDRTPDHCPTDPLAKQDFLRAHALLALTQGRGTRSGRPEVTIVVDIRTLLHGWHEQSRVDTGVDGLDLPLGRIRYIAGIADIIPILLDEQGVVLQMGRTVRLATRAQRRALRAMYRTCAIPGCGRSVGGCEPHHTIPWNAGGDTDIEVLVPICPHHHDLIHQHGWTLTLHPDRSLDVTFPDGSVMSTGPPAEQWQ